APRVPGTVVGRVVVQKGGAAKGDVSNVVVYLESSASLPTSRHHSQLKQRNSSFAPNMLVIQKGTTVDFPNEDRIFHNVFSVSEPARFDLGLYKSGSSRSYTFNRAGVVDVYCNIHPDMVAKIKVVDSPYYVVASRDGAFRISNVPP